MEDLEKLLPYVESRGRTVTARGSEETICDPLQEDLRLMSLTLSAGQDSDLQQRSRTLSHYVELVARKTCPMTAFAISAGVRVAGAEAAAVEAARLCGHHIGFLIQLLDDLEAATHSTHHEFGSGHGLTFPVLVAMEAAPELAEALVVKATAPDPGDIRRELARLGAGAMMVDLVERHRAKALECASAFDRQGFVEVWLRWVLRDVEPLGSKLDGV